MEEIKEKPSLNIGGNASVYFIRYDKILNVPRSVRSIISADLTITGYWSSIETVPYSIEYSENERESDEGCYIQSTVSFVVPQETPNKLAKLKALRNQRLAVIVVDNSTGKARLIGNNKEFLIFDRSFRSGDSPADLNADSVTLSGNIKTGALFYTGAISVDPTETTESVSFNLGGISQIQFCEQRKFLGYSDGNILLVDDWLDINVVPYTTELRERESPDAPGSSCVVSLGFVIAQETSELNYKLRLLRERKLVFRIVDQSTGLIRIVGGTKENLKRSRRFRTGNSPSDLNANRIDFEGSFKNGYSFFSGTTETPPLLIDEDGSFIIDGDLAFIGYE